MQVRYILYDPETGAIRQWGECAQKLLKAHERDGLKAKKYAWGGDIAERKVDKSGRVVKQ